MSNRIGKSGGKRCSGEGRVRGDSERREGPAGKPMQRNSPQHKFLLKNGAIALPEHFGMCLAPPKRKSFPTRRYVMQLASLKSVGAILVAAFLILSFAKQ